MLLRRCAKVLCCSVKCVPWQALWFKVVALERNKEIGASPASQNFWCCPEFLHHLVPIPLDKVYYLKSHVAYVNLINNKDL